MNDSHTNIGELTDALGVKPDSALKFHFEGSAINPGYHVTEVRHAAIKSIDCGKNSNAENWDEITIQLLDGSAQSTQEHMPVGKFLGIVSSALNSLSAETAPFLYFEYAPDNGPIRKLSIESIDQGDQEITVSLGSERAVCKPFQRARVFAALSGGPATQLSGAGCCSTNSEPDGSSCCG